MKSEVQTAFGVMELSPRSSTVEMAAREDSVAMKRVPVSDEEARIAASLGLSRSEFAEAKASRQADGPMRCAIASSLLPSASTGLLRAHQEVDRAHDAAYSGDHGEAWTKAPAGQLLDQAISELKAYDPNKPGSYDRLLNGALHVMCLLNRVAPPFANTQQFKPGRR